MRHVLRFVVGLISALVCAASLLVLFLIGFIILKEGIAAKGDTEQFEAAIRHYTDELRLDKEGNLRIDQAAHPIAQVTATGLGAMLLAMASGWNVRRMTPSARRRDSRHA